MRLAAKRALGSKKKPVRKVNSKSRGVKIKLKIKSKSPEGLANAVGKLSKGLNGVNN